MLYFCGDPHGNFQPVEQVARSAGLHAEGADAAQPAEKVDAFVLLGDCDLPAPLEQLIPNAAHHTWWIHGNHDCDRTEWYDHLFGSALAHRSLHGRVCDVAGWRIAGLGGVFRHKVWHPAGGVRRRQRADYLALMRPAERWRGGIPLRQRASIWREDYDQLLDQKADILVCHEAPSCHPHGFAVLDELARAMGVRLIVHGHHHVTYGQTLPSGIRVQGVGEAQVVDIHGQLIA